METNENQPNQESQPQETVEQTAPIEAPVEETPQEAPAPEPVAEIAVPETAVIDEETGLTPQEVQQRTEIGKTEAISFGSERDDLYTIEAADLNRYPELSGQGVQYGDRVAYGSLWVLKSATAGGAADTRTPFPQSTSSKKFPSWQNL